MNKEYLRHTRSLEELDKLIEQDRQAAAQLAQVTFTQAITLAIHNISEINLIAGARIQAECNVNTAQIASSAEICTAELSAAAELAVGEIHKKRSDPGVETERLSAMVTMIGRHAEDAITHSAIEAVKKINAEAQAAIERINQHSNDSIASIQELSQVVSAEIVKRSDAAKTMLDAVREEPLTPESIVSDAERLAEELHRQSQESLERLREEVTQVTKKTNDLVDLAIAELQLRLNETEQHIRTARDTAIKRIREFVEKPPD